MDTPKTQVDYLKCPKSGLHDQQCINIVCLEKLCLQNVIGCCACMESQHKKHRTKPLKMVVNEARSTAAQFKPSKINFDIMLDIAKSHKNKVQQFFAEQKRTIIDSLNSIEKALQSYFNHTIDQILLKNSDGNILIEEALQRAICPKNLEDLKQTMKKLVVVLSQLNNKGRDRTQEELKQSLKDSSESIQKSIETSMNDVKAQLQKFQGSVINLISSSNLWQMSYKFSTELKHTDIKVLAENRVKAANCQGYKFALMHPEAQKHLTKTYSFSIKESKSNWLGIGFCHKGVVKAKNYSFTFGSIGHGAYMISSNGGSWSHTKAEHNNTLKAIKFGKGDTVHATLNHQLGKILFSKNNSSEQYELPFQEIAEDHLHPCVLFYYMNDEVEYLGNAKN